MAISEDLRSIQTMRGSTVMTNLNEPLADLLRLACVILWSLAELVEALEELSLTCPEESADSSSVCSVFSPARAIPAKLLCNRRNLCWTLYVSLKLHASEALADSAKPALK